MSDASDVTTQPTAAARSALVERAGRERALPCYAEEAPSAALAPWVACYWTMHARDASPVTSRVLPDGCADVIVDLSARPDPYVVGTMRRALVVPFAGRVDMFGVRFRPGGALPFLGASLAELCDRRVPLDALWGGVAGELADALASAAPGERAASVERVLRRRAREPRPEEVAVARAVALLRRARGGARVRDVAAALGVGERWLERAFDRCVGLSPKMLARVLRFRHAVRRIERRDGEGDTWAGVAFAAGYADQPHLIREFRELAGATPAEYAAEHRRVGFVQYGDGRGA